ncbi:MAG: hypothetical protein AAGL90_17020 [Pseudomonadota bacterium]
MRNILSDGRTIIATGLAFLVIGFAFGLWIGQFDLEILDTISDPDQVRSVVAAMTPAQKSAHFWMTIVLDYPYPLAYGAFFGGIALRFYGRAGKWLAIPALIAVSADVIENTIQLLILSGDDVLIWLKVIMTQIKFAAFLPAALIALTGLGLGAYRRFFG